MGKLHRLRHIILAAIIIVAAAAMYIISPSISMETLESVEEMLPHTTLWALLALIVIYCCRILLFFVPIVLLFTLTGMMFPPVWGILISYLCLAFELSIGYGVGKKMGRNKVNKLAERNKPIRAMMKTGLKILLSSHSPSVIKPSQAMGAVAREPREGEIPVELIRCQPIDDFP